MLHQFVVQHVLRPDHRVLNTVSKTNNDRPKIHLRHFYRNPYVLQSGEAKKHVWHVSHYHEVQLQRVRRLLAFTHTGRKLDIGGGE